VHRFKFLPVLIVLLLNGHVFAQNAPVTVAPVRTACPGSNVTLPVTVTGFNSIGSVSLTLKYNPAVLTYVSASNTSGFPGLTFGHGIPGKVVISGFASSGISLPDNAILFTLTLHYINGSSALTWYDVGSTCEYTGYPGFATLNDLPFENYYTNGQVGPELDVSFQADINYPETGQTVAFTDLTTGSPTSWNWSVTPSSIQFVNGTTPTVQNPQVQCLSNGLYTVSLTAGKNGCYITRTLNDYLHAGTQGLWTGLVSTDWTNPANWHNYTVPGAGINVVVPSQVNNSPVFDGDLIIGGQIGSLTLQGPGSTMTVTGDLTIQSEK